MKTFYLIQTYQRSAKSIKNKDLISGFSLNYNFFLELCFILYIKMKTFLFNFNLSKMQECKNPGINCRISFSSFKTCNIYIYIALTLNIPISTYQRSVESVLKKSGLNFRIPLKLFEICSIH